MDEISDLRQLVQKQAEEITQLKKQLGALTRCEACGDPRYGSGPHCELCEGVYAEKGKQS
jgi:hypothetical protein